MKNNGALWYNHEPFHISSAPDDILQIAMVLYLYLYMWPNII